MPQPTCGYVLKNDYPDYLGSPEAEARRRAHAGRGRVPRQAPQGRGHQLDTEFTGEVPEKIVYHAPCHLRAQNMGLRSRDLMKLTGAKITVVAECSGIDGTWGLRTENYEMARGVAKKMAKAIDKADADVVAGDCSLANGGIVLETGKTAQHPLSVVARAYGIPATSPKTQGRSHDQAGPRRHRRPPRLRTRARSTPTHDHRTEEAPAHRRRARS